MAFPRLRNSWELLVVELIVVLGALILSAIIKKRPERGRFFIMAERMRFELTVGLTLRPLSRRVP